jgi:mRNA-degrading endonuclease toxin of MazEF toxin-antitoxin module
MMEMAPVLPRRGEIHLAAVPFAAGQSSLRPSTQDLTQSSTAADFTTEVQFKLRPVLVVQADAITGQPGYEYLLVAPIYTVHAQHRARPEYQALVAQQLPQVFYLDRREQGVTHPSYVALAQLQLLHRSVFRERRGTMAPNEMRQIDERLRFWLGL